MKMATVLYRVWQWTWGFPQSLAGLLLFLYVRLRRAGTGERYVHSTLTLVNAERIKAIGCISLGMYIFVTLPPRVNKDSERVCGVIRHEYGHTIQSLILGPLYLVLVGLPSLLWCMFYNSKRSKGMRERGVKYYDRYPENWATRCGDKHTPIKH